MAENDKLVAGGGGGGIVGIGNMPREIFLKRDPL